MAAKTPEVFGSADDLSLAAIVDEKLRRSRLARFVAETGINGGLWGAWWLLYLVRHQSGMVSPELLAAASLGITFASAINVVKLAKNAFRGGRDVESGEKSVETNVRMFAVDDGDDWPEGTSR